MTDDDRIYECERCGHAYTRRYGRYVEIPGGAAWRCLVCIDPPKKKEQEQDS